MGLFRGFVAPFQGAVFVSRERLWHLVALPVLLNIALAGGSAWAAARYWREELSDRAVGSPALASILFFAATALGTVVLFVVLQPLVGAIFNDLLAERVERKILGQSPRVPFFGAAVRAIGHAVLKLVLYTAAFVASLAVGAVTAGIGGAVGIGLGALLLAYDGFDYPLARRSAGFWAKWRYLALHPAQTIGYGLGATVFYLIPLALVVAPPLMAVGATLLYLETESRSAQKRSAKQSKGKGRVDETSALRDGQG